MWKYVDKGIFDAISQFIISNILANKIYIISLKCTSYQEIYVVC